MDFAPVPTLGDVEIERKAIDDEILRLQCRRNNLAPIARLPPELIANIIVFYQASYPPAQRSSLISITQVSRRMRSIAIGHPPLWAHLNLCAPKEWNVICLRRSKAVPLSIHGLVDSLTVDAAKNSLMVLKGHEGQFKVLDLTVSGFANRLNFEGTAPKLEKLILRCLNGVDNLDLSVGMFSKRINSLRHIELEKCRFSWTNEILTNLTYLSIHSPPDPYRTQPHAILAVLGAMPELRTLSLWDTLSSAIANETSSNETSSSLPDVRLPYLMKMSIRDDSLSAITTLISHIRHPAATKLDFISHNAVSSTIDAFFDCIPSISHDNTSVTAPSSSESEGCRHIQSLTLVSDLFVSSLGFRYADDWEESFTATFRFSHPTSLMVIEPSKLISTINKLRIDHVEKLIVRGHGVDSSELMKILARTRNLKTLYVGGTTYDVFSQTLEKSLPGCVASVAKRARERNTKAKERAVTKGRKKKKIGKATQNHSCKKCTTFINSTLANLEELKLADGDLYSNDILFQYLVFRQEIGKQLGRLEIESCRSVSKYLSEYRGYVKVVDWDGVSPSEEEDDPDEWDGGLDYEDYDYDDFDLFDMYEGGPVDWWDLW
ncbi:hypothetical protein AX16_002589 [Volvariella volvacea WC 439]|nr:hypothetical protein AX16_002589 [Volvariella volvacea WC 439]